MKLRVHKPHPVVPHQKPLLYTRFAVGKKVVFSAHSLLKCWQGVAGCPSPCHQPAKVSSTCEENSEDYSREAGLFSLLGHPRPGSFVFSNEIKLNGI